MTHFQRYALKVLPSVGNKVNEFITILEIVINKMFYL